MKEISDILQEADAIQTERGIKYGNAHISAGKVYAALFPDGIELRNEKDFTIFVTLMNIIMKTNRIAKSFKSGHRDSAIDLINYAAILAYKYERADSSE